MDLYYVFASPPCRTVMMAAAALRLDVNKKSLDFFTGEHLKPEFLRINPQHTIPTLVDNGFSLWESRAILVYLVEKYGKSDANSLYPKDIKQRATIHQRLYYDMGTLYKAFGEYYYPTFKLKLQPDAEKFKKVEEAFALLNTFLEGGNYVAGTTAASIADISILSTVSSIVVFDFDLTKYPNVAKWYEHCKQLVPGWEENWEGCLALRAYFEHGPTVPGK